MISNFFNLLDVSSYLSNRTIAEQLHNLYISYCTCSGADYEIVYYGNFRVKKPQEVR